MKEREAQKKERNSRLESERHGLLRGLATGMCSHSI